MGKPLSLGFMISLRAEYWETSDLEVPQLPDLLVAEAVHPLAF